MSSHEHSLVFVSLENWDEIWRRNQFVCAEIARRHPGMKILFIGLQRNMIRLLLSGRFAELFSPWAGPVAGHENILFSRPLRVALDRFSWGRRFNEWLFRRHVHKAIRRFRLKDHVLWINPHYAVHLVGKTGEKAVIYDITDDWTSMESQSAEQSSLIRHQDAELCGRADAVIVCSQRLLELKAALAGNLHLIPNGVDAEHYRSVLDDSSAVRGAAAAWPKPVLGYTGTLHPDRVDVELIRSLAQAPGVGSVALVGPNYLTAADMARLKLANVFIPGAVSYSEIPNVMKAFDVCIVPHRVTAFTESLNPIKLWEYLAAGKPIVSTDVAGFREYPGLVSIAASADEFSKLALAALGEDPNLRVARRAEARRHSWAERVDEIEQVIEGAIAARKRDGQLVG